MSIQFVVFLGILFVLAMMLTSPIWISALGNALNSIAGGGGAGGGGAGDSAAPSVALTGSPTHAGNEIPDISARVYIAGDAPITVTGAFSFASTIGLNTAAALSDGVETNLPYGFDPEDQTVPGFQLAFSRREGAEGLGLNIYSGDWVATYIGEDCSWEVEVTDLTLSGHISCTDLPAVNQADGTTGTVDVEFDFTADSPPGD